jgi:catechol 2,3-dioxygenase-like lactoylglutathione lyase family enzyme
MEPAMQLLKGVNHVAIVTQDLDRFVDFYTRMFGVDEVFRESAPTWRHAILRTGPDSWLHPAEITGNPHGPAIPEMFRRGHLDHIALTAATPEAFETVRGRLKASGASSGAVDDLGAFHSLWFEDPDGMRGEITLIVDPQLAGIHEPRPYADTGS